MLQMRTDILSIILVISFLLLSGFCNASGKGTPTKQQDIRKVKDIIIYKDSQYYSAFPSVIKTDEQDYMVAFRRAPERKIFEEKGSSHVDPNSYLVSVRSRDGGKTFKWESMGFQRHPLNAFRLPDNRVLLTYGYHHKPYGIRARILNAECTDYAVATEFVLRDDGGTTDLGYTWPVLYFS